MLDTIAALFFFGFFAFLIYVTVFRHQKTPVLEEKKPSPPGPVGLFCWICHMPAGTVSAQEYQRMSQTGVEPPYCQSCSVIVKTYKAKHGER